MSDTSIIPTDPSLGSLRAGYENYPAGASQPNQEQAHPLRMLHLFLRGRYWLLAILVLVLTPLGAWLGYRFGKVDYECRGEIRIQPNMPSILYGQVDNNLQGMFDQYMDAQCATIMSHRCIELAFSAYDSEWKKLSTPRPADFEDTLANELTVTHQGIRIDVTVIDADKQLAKTAVFTLVHAFEDLYKDDSLRFTAVRDAALDQRHTQLLADKKDLQDQIMNLAKDNPFGTDDLDKAYDTAFAHWQQLSVNSDEVQAAILRGGAAVFSGQETGEVLLRKIASDDPRMAEAMSERDTAQRDLTELKIGGLLDKNDVVKRAKAELTTANANIEEYKQEYQKNKAMAQAEAGNTIGGATTQPIETLKDYAQKLGDQKDAALQELNKLGDMRLTLKDLKDRLESKERDLDEVTRRIDEIAVEQPVITSGREQITSEGDMADKPHSDTHIAIAALGGFGGFSVAALFVTLLGLRDRRFRGPEDTQFSPIRCPMLGMLPTLTSDLADTEQAAMAAHFVHGIRAMLQIKGNNQSGRVIAITSPSAHNGKTSISLALGVSFAGAHSKTLLIDCDFIGRALSERLNAVARPRLGRVLREQGLIDDVKLQEGLDHSVLHGKRLGEALVGMGHLAEDKLEAALAAQKDHTFGVLEAIDGEDLAECTAPTAIPGLSILPLGQASPEHIGSLSPAMLRQVLEATRQKYDVVIVDTGPILGSLEAAMVATQADDVVLVLSNGENRGSAERSLRYLESVGAKVAGFVFNRAPTRDFLASNSALHMSSSADRWRHSRSWSKSETLSEYGPVARAVARSVGEADGPKMNGAARQNGNGHNGSGRAA
jgi:Mrp family chromosome partitioning ATPase/uncharacterized protein involved in exopolysaccharide biosynthesis